MSTKPELIEQFKVTAQKADAQVSAVSDLAELERLLLDYAGEYRVLLAESDGFLAQSGLADRLAQKGVRISDQHTESEVSVTPALFGIADTGSVVIDTTDDLVTKLTALARSHIVILNPDSILPNLQSAFEAIDKLGKTRTNFRYSIITGPSRTADIERVLTLGVHGPAKLDILLWDYNK